MEYLLGSLVTILCVYVINRLVVKSVSSAKISIRYSQSHFHSIMSSLEPPMIKPRPITQANKHNSNNTIRILYMDGNAYWFDGGVFYTAKVSSKKIQEETIKVLDMFDIDSVELDKMAFIVQQLTDGK
jgi:hypothetical protein